MFYLRYAALVFFSIQTCWASGGTAQEDPFKDTLITNQFFAALSNKGADGQENAPIKALQDHLLFSPGQSTKTLDPRTILDLLSGEGHSLDYTQSFNSISNTNATKDQTAIMLWSAYQAGRKHNPLFFGNLSQEIERGFSSEFQKKSQHVSTQAHFKAIYVAFSLGYLTNKPKGNYDDIATRTIEKLLGLQNKNDFTVATYQTYKDKIIHHIKKTFDHHTDKNIPALTEQQAQQQIGNFQNFILPKIRVLYKNSGDLTKIIEGTFNQKLKQLFSPHKDAINSALLSSQGYSEANHFKDITWGFNDESGIKTKMIEEFKVLLKPLKNLLKDFDSFDVSDTNLPQTLKNYKAETDTLTHEIMEKIAQLNPIVLLKNSRSIDDFTSSAKTPIDSIYKSTNFKVALKSKLMPLTASLKEVIDVIGEELGDIPTAEALEGALNSLGIDELFNKTKALADYYPALEAQIARFNP